jgi:hypothetical protein
MSDDDKALEARVVRRHFSVGGGWQVSTPINTPACG